jgi:hypothetical protein
MKASNGWKFCIATVIALFVATTSDSTFAQPDPLTGKWSLNIAKSKFSPAPNPAPKSAVIVFSPSGADGVKAVYDGISTAGDKTHWEYTANHDGKDYPMTGNPEGDAISLKRINASSVETTYKKGGKVTVVNVRTGSADGKTLTVTVKGTNAQGRAVNHLLVFEKS